MPDKRDVFEDNTVAGNQPGSGGKGGSPATTFKPGEKPFKDKKKSPGHGYSHVPGAGENPGKIAE
jgi:hypothetical protein